MVAVFAAIVAVDVLTAAGRAGVVDTVDVDAGAVQYRPSVPCPRRGPHPGGQTGCLVCQQVNDFLDIARHGRGAHTETLGAMGNKGWVRSRACGEATLSGRARQRGS